MPSNIHHPLLKNSSTNTIFPSKNTLLFLLSTSALISCLFIAPHLIKFTPKSISNTNNVDQQQHNTLTLLKSLLTKSLLQLKTSHRIIKITNHEKTAPLADCIQLIEMSIDTTFSAVAALNNWKTQSDIENAHTWISAILTNHFTCLDGLDELVNATTSEPVKFLLLVLEELISRTRTSLALVASLSSGDDHVLHSLSGGFPGWMSGRDRRLVGSSLIKADAVVAKDGSGKYKSIKEAVEGVPDKSKSRYVIYVKKGVYKENVEVGKKKMNVMIYGDGMDSTVITGSLNVVDGSTTFRSATLAVAGDGFILQDIKVQNTAGPEKHQAVALRVSADQTVINRCQIDAYQDTLYTHTFRQFYRDCIITGTVDFIFGNAAVVLQNSKIIARKPLQNQKNMVTAQGREDPNQNTGISIQACEIIPSSDLDPVWDSYKTYLGRPWKKYSRTVVMQSYIGGHIDAAGWAEWNKDFGLKTLYYGEFANRGPGAGTSKRVNWSGYHVISDPNEAKKFTVAELIQGQAWLSSSGVSYTEGL